MKALLPQTGVWAVAILMLMAHSNAQDLICTAIPNNSYGVNDTFCNTTCFAKGAAETPDTLAIYCTEFAEAAQVCNCTSAPVDCVGTLGQFSPCTASCGGGSQTAVFTITTYALFGGKACAHADGELVIQACNVDPCPSTDFVCLAIPGLPATNDWCASNCWPPGLTAKTFANAHPACTTAGGKSQVCICNNIVTPAVQCLPIPGQTATPEWCAQSCWVGGLPQTIANLVNYCTTDGGQSQVCSCELVGPDIGSNNNGTTSN